MDLLQACSNSLALMDKILACIHEAIIVTDLEGRIRFSSSVVEKVFGYAPAELEGENLSIIFTPEDLRYLYPNLLHMARKDMPFEGELMLLRKDGNHFFAFIGFESHLNLTSEQSIISVCVRDIQKEKQLEKSFRESHYEELVQMANGIAHEIRNPLMGIGGFVNRLHKSGKTVHNHDKYYGYIINNLKKIEDLVKKVDFFANLPRPSFAEESMKELLEKTLEPFQGHFEASGIDLTVRMKKMVLLVDKNLVTNVFSILIANAMDALADGGKIMIHNDANEIQAKIHVSDTGTGITSEDLPHIFNPFFSTKPHGAGIDLATAKRIMDNHGGTIGVTSIKGSGTSFTLCFPVERRQPLRSSPLNLS